MSDIKKGKPQEWENVKIRSSVCEILRRMKNDTMIPMAAYIERAILDKLKKDGYETLEERG